MHNEKIWLDWPSPTVENNILNNETGPSKNMEIFYQTHAGATKPKSDASWQFQMANRHLLKPRKYLLRQQEQSSAAS